tara:strand:- start:5557 stop:5790 length:234 start_codon:yes stop_codon:yes gene_type:complete
MIRGTSYFPTLADAISYYHVSKIPKEQVLYKIETKEIFIGVPPLKKGERLLLRSEYPKHPISKRWKVPYRWFIKSDH